MGNGGGGRKGILPTREPSRVCALGAVIAKHCDDQMLVTHYLSSFGKVRLYWEPGCFRQCVYLYGEGEQLGQQLPRRHCHAGNRIAGEGVVPPAAATAVSEIPVRICSKNCFCYWDQARETVRGEEMGEGGESA